MCGRRQQRHDQLAVAGLPTGAVACWRGLWRGHPVVGRLRDALCTLAATPASQRLPRSSHGLLSSLVVPAGQVKSTCGSTGKPAGKKERLRGQAGGRQVDASCVCRSAAYCRATGILVPGPVTPAPLWRRPRSPPSTRGQKHQQGCGSGGECAHRSAAGRRHNQLPPRLLQLPKCPLAPEAPRPLPISSPLRLPAPAVGDGRGAQMRGGRVCIEAGPPNSPATVPACTVQLT